MHLNLSGKRVLVVGGTGGIGSAIVGALIAENADVAVFARDQGKLSAIDKDHSYKNIITKSVDVTDEINLHHAIASIVEEWKGIDCLVSTVSSMSLQPGDDSWERAYQIDLLATVRVIRACKNHIAASNGNIVIVGSTASSEVSPLIIETYGGEQPYGAVKAGLVNLVKNLSYELAKRGARINMVSPGNVYIPGGPWDEIKASAPELYEKMLQENPLGRMGTPEEIANCVLFFLSDKSSFVTGHNLLVDGGLTRAPNY